MRPILLLLACALIAACGSDDDGLSAEDYRKQANELCEKVNAEIARLDPPRSPQQFADFLQRGFDASEKYEERFRQLDPPEELHGLHERALRLNEDLERDFERVIERIRRAKDPIAAFQEELQALLPAIQRGDEINRRLKLDECLQSPALRGAGVGTS